MLVAASSFLLLSRQMIDAAPSGVHLFDADGLRMAGGPP